MKWGCFISKLSIIIPTLNESDNISSLVTRINTAFNGNTFTYEIIFIDDHSTDSTVSEIIKYQDKYPVRVFLKKGHRGTVESLIEGIHEAKFQIIATLDATLQYPPEALPRMLHCLQRDGSDIVVANRVYTYTSRLRAATAKISNHRISKRLLRLNVDSQSTMKVFRKKIVSRITINPDPLISSPHFLLRARSAGYKITGYNVNFPNRVKKRTTRLAKNRFYSPTFSALKLRLSQNHYVPFDQYWIQKKGFGFHYKGKEYVTHNTLERQNSAIERTTTSQRLILAGLVTTSVALIILNVQLIFILIVSVITVLYFLDLLFNMFLIYRSFQSYSEIAIDDSEIAKQQHWPSYSILCPLYKEALVVPQFIAAMEKIDYPKKKLEVLLLLEEGDDETITALKNMNLPNYFKTIIVPNSMPKTKPKACNYGLLIAGGEYTVIYDAEDIPDPLQLKKAVIAFQRAGEAIGCIQAKLNYYNWNQNLLTRLFTLEYSLWFNLILTGLQSISAPIPLGGTSNHFRTKILRDLGGWDPFNVTEDADLGIRLAKQGLKTAVLDSTTLEEANSEFGNWLKQRSRWIKGYMQTYLVHMRDLREFSKNSRRIDIITFQLVIGGKVLSMLINPILWTMTIAYFVFRPQVGPLIESLYLAPIFYLGAIALVIGNFMYLYYYMMGAARQGRPELIIYAFFVPIYWLMMSIAAYYALRDLTVRPFHWHKTKHGLHLKPTPNQATEEITA